MTTVGVVGYGEVGRILAEDLRARGTDVVAYDLKLDDDRRAGLVEHADAHGVRLLADHAAVATASDLVVSAVTADQAVAAAESLAPGLRPGTYVLDMNSASPGAKARAARAVDAAGGRYVEGAVMTSIPPYRLRVPILLGGPHAAAAAPLLADLGFTDAAVHDERLGVASATKLARSVVIKGMEALFVESLTTARHFGVEDAVLASFAETFPGIDWDAQASYFFARATRHGRRRSDEMREAANTVAESGLGPLASLSTAARQAWLADLADAGALRVTDDWREAADLIRGHVAHRTDRRGETMTHGETTGDFTKTEGWLDWYDGPSEPAFTLPAGAVDAHCHVFGPGGEFPYAPERKYTPCDASADQLFALRDHLGFERNVIVQATCHGADNSAMVDAVRRSNGKARGVATVRRDVTPEQLAELHEAGVRGVRFNFVKRLVDAVPTDALEEIVAKIAPLGWHVVIYFEAEDLPDLYDFFAAIPTTVVVDHMGRPDVTKDVDGPEFGLFLRFMRENSNVWCKVTCPERLTVSGPAALDGERDAYTDVVPFARRVVEEFPTRVLWGTDWPHPNLKSHMPDDGLLVDFIPHIAPTDELQRQLLVDNPMRLYWPEEYSGSEADLGNPPASERHGVGDAVGQA